MKKRFISIICVFFAVILVPSGISIFKGQSDFYEKENRALATRPSFSFADLMDGFFQEEYESYISDQYVFRDELVSAKTFAFKLIGKKDINNIYLGKNGYLIEKYLPTSFDEDNVNNNIELLSAFLNESSKKYNTGCVIIPSKVSVLDNQLPDNAKPYNTDYVAENISSMLNESVNFLYLKDELKNHNNEYIYYKTDHHWTSLGAYYGYKSILKEFYRKDIDKNSFEIKRIADDFLGTDYDKLQIKNSADSITRYDYKNKINVFVDYNGEEENRCDLYLNSALNEKDKYAYFLGGNYSRIDITTDADNNKTLLLVKDSFSNSLVPFLIRDYSKIIVVDLRYADESIDSVFSGEDITDVLVVYNTEKFMNDNNQSLLISEDYEEADEDFEGLDIPEDEELN